MATRRHSFQCHPIGARRFVHTMRGVTEVRIVGYRVVLSENEQAGDGLPDELPNELVKHVVQAIDDPYRQLLDYTTDMISETRTGAAMRLAEWRLSILADAERAEPPIRGDADV